MGVQVCEPATGVGAVGHCGSCAQNWDVQQIKEPATEQTECIKSVTGGIWSLCECVFTSRYKCIHLFFHKQAFTPGSQRREQDVSMGTAFACPSAVFPVCVGLCYQSCVCVYRTYVCLLGIIPFWKLASLLAGPWDMELYQFCFNQASRLKRSYNKQNKIWLCWSLPTIQGGKWPWNALLKLHSLHKVLLFKWTLNHHYQRN